MTNSKDPKKNQDPPKLGWIIGSAIKPESIRAWRGVEFDDELAWLMEVIQAEYPDSHPDYHATIFRRFVVMYEGILPCDARFAIMKGFTSPCAAMAARVIPRANYIGNES